MVEKQFECSICHREFHTPEAKQEHTVLRHKGEYHAPQDGYTLPTISVYAGEEE